VAVSTDYKRLFLRGLYRSALRAPCTLVAMLNGLVDGSYKSTNGGRTIISTAASGRKVDFETPPAGRGITQLDVAETVSQLMDLYEESHDALVSAGVTSPTDSQIYDEMLDRLIARRSVRSDFSGSVSIFYGNTQ
jgi:hypothetical protein